jgi:PST family polysaccharide transporter
MGTIPTFFNKNLLLKVASFNSVHVFLRIVTGAIMSNIIANYVGAAGMGIIGNLRNFVQGVQSFAVLGLENGLVKNTAQLKDQKEKLAQTLATGWTLAFVAAIIMMVVVYATAPWLNRVLIAADYSFVTLFRVFAGVLPFWVLFVFMSSLLQGFEHYRKFITLNIIIGLCVFAMSALLIYERNLVGALYSIILTPVVQCVVALFFWKYAIGAIGFSKFFAMKLDGAAAKQLLKFSLMALVSAFLLPLVAILVRDHVRLTVSDEAAGWWEAMVRIASYYMMFITSLISLYVLPRLSANDTASNYRATIASFYKTMLPIVVLGMIVVYLLRDFLIAFLFSAEFEPVSALFKWQLVGDFIKVVTTVLAFRFIAVNDLKRYLLAEFISVLCFYLAAHVLITSYGVEGVVMAHVITYAVYLATLLVMLRKELWG